VRLYRKESLASVQVLALAAGEGERLVEAVESVQPPVPREKKWVLIISTHFGCPVRCAMCDAGGHWGGPLSAEQMLAQVDRLVAERYPDRRLPQEKLKVQFARMGEPALNPAVLEALRLLPERLEAPGLMPCVSSIAPAGRERFFDELRVIKDELYSGGRFQLQFSLHSTDPVARRRLIPVRTWDLRALARYGERYYRAGDRKLTLNFAACEGFSIDPAVIAEHFDPARFLVKLTPLNPTSSVRSAALRSWIDAERPESAQELAAALAERGFEVLVSIGELEENAIGSNCGQLVSELEAGQLGVREGYASQQYAASQG